jgi:hypothetical protein
MCLAAGLVSWGREDVAPTFTTNRMEIFGRCSSYRVDHNYIKHILNSRSCERISSAKSEKLRYFAPRGGE